MSLFSRVLPDTIPWTRMRRIFPDVIGLLTKTPYLLVGTISALILKEGVDPVFSWMAKSVFDSFEGEEFITVGSMMEYVPLFAVLVFTVAFAELAQEVLKEMYEKRLLINTQRLYMIRRRTLKRENLEDVSRVLIDCEKSKKVFEMVYKQSGEIVVGAVAVIIWQLSISPEWLPALLIAVLPSLFITFLFGPWIQKHAHGILRDMGRVAESTGEHHRGNFYQSQESLYKEEILFESFKKAAEVSIELSKWLGAALVLFIVYYLGWGIIPDTITAGNLALLAGNFEQLSKPVKEVGKVYIHLREGYPALCRALDPQDTDQ